MLATVEKLTTDRRSGLIIIVGRLTVLYGAEGGGVVGKTTAPAHFSPKTNQLARYVVKNALRILIYY
jgi:hypothetical protein